MSFEFALPNDVPKETGGPAEPVTQERTPKAFDSMSPMETIIDPGAPLDGGMDASTNGRVELGEDDGLRTDFTEMRTAEEVAAQDGGDLTGDRTFESDVPDADWGAQLTIAARGFVAKLHGTEQSVALIEQPPEPPAMPELDYTAPDVAATDVDDSFIGVSPTDSDRGQTEYDADDYAQVVDAEIVDEQPSVPETTYAEVVDAEIVDAEVVDAPASPAQPETVFTPHETAEPAEPVTPDSYAETGFEAPEVVEEAVFVDDGPHETTPTPTSEMPQQSTEEIWEAEIIPDEVTEGREVDPEYAEHAQLETFEDTPEHRVEDAEVVSDEEYQEVLRERNKQLGEEMGEREERWNDAYHKWQDMKSSLFDEGRLRDLFDPAETTAAEPPTSEGSPWANESFETPQEAAEQPESPEQPGEAEPTADAPHDPLDEGVINLTKEQTEQLMQDGIPEEWHSSVRELLEVGLEWEDAVDLAKGAMERLEQHERTERHENLDEMQEHYEKMWKEQVAGGQKPNTTEWVVKDENKVIRAAKILGAFFGSNAAGAVFASFQKFTLRGQPEALGKPSWFGGRQEFRLTVSNGSNVSSVVVKAHNAEEAAGKVDSSFITRANLGKKLN